MSPQACRVSAWFGLISFMNMATDLNSGFDFQSYLRTELTQRCRANAAYSLRAFARDLDVEPSALSKILSGKRAITHEMKTRFGKKLKLTRQQLNVLRCAKSVSMAEDAADFGESSASSSGSAGLYRLMAEDSFRILSDWYHYAILELTKVDHFRSDAA